MSQTEEAVSSAAKTAYGVNTMPVRIPDGADFVRAAVNKDLKMLMIPLDCQVGRLMSGTLCSGTVLKS